MKTKTTILLKHLKEKNIGIDDITKDAILKAMDAILKAMDEYSKQFNNGDSITIKGKIYRIADIEDCMNNRLEPEERPIDNVTPELLHLAFRMVGIHLDKRTIDHIIDLVELLELLEYYGGDTTMKQVLEDPINKNNNESIYYIRKEGYVGNSLIWWRPNYGGYTTNLDEAGRYTYVQAMQICKSNKTNVAYKHSTIFSKRECIFKTIHADFLKYSDSDINYCDQYGNERDKIQGLE